MASVFFFLPLLLCQRVSGAQPTWGLFTVVLGGVAIVCGTGREKIANALAIPSHSGKIKTGVDIIIDNEHLL